jgi:AcrR family transcriptional regulator
MSMRSEEGHAALSRVAAAPDGVEPPRRVLTARQVDRLDRLTGAAVDELRENGYEGLTVRRVAARGGVAPATAYTYFASKNHLVAEVFWRRLQAMPDDPVEDSTPEDAVVAVLRRTALLVADEPALAAACSIAVLSQEPEVRHLRDLIGIELVRRLEEALGEKSSPELITSLTAHWAGSFLLAGMGYSTYEGTADELERASRALMR